VGWRVSNSLRSDLALDAIEQALHDRPDIDDLFHHCDRGTQYRSIRYTERLAEAGIEPSVGSVGDYYDNALAESVNGIYKTELIWKDGPWRCLEHVECATLEWVWWYNSRRLHSSLGHVPPVEYEATYRCGRSDDEESGTTTRSSGLCPEPHRGAAPGPRGKGGAEGSPGETAEHQEAPVTVAGLT